MCEFIYRSGGETVYVSSEYPNGLTQTEYNALCHKNPKLRKRDWRIMVRDARVYVKGRVWHPDYATIPSSGLASRGNEFGVPNSFNEKRGISRLKASTYVYQNR